MKVVNRTIEEIRAERDRVKASLNRELVIGASYVSPYTMGELRILNRELKERETKPLKTGDAL